MCLMVFYKVSQKVLVLSQSTSYKCLITYAVFSACYQNVYIVTRFSTLPPFSTCPSISTLLLLGIDKFLPWLYFFVNKAIKCYIIYSKSCDIGLNISSFVYNKIHVLLYINMVILCAKSTIFCTLLSFPISIYIRSI